MGLLAGIAGGAARAEPYPSHAVTFITPFAAGGPTDVIARVTAKRLSERLGQPVVVQNVLGGGGVIGTEQAANAKPDGYTLYLAVNSLAIYPSVQPPERPLPFDPVKSFKAIGGIATSAHVIVVGPDLGVKTLAELVDMARKNPEKRKRLFTGSNTSILVEPGSSPTISGVSSGSPAKASILLMRSSVPPRVIWPSVGFTSRSQFERIARMACA